MPSIRCRFASRLGHLYPFLSGCGTIANSRLLQTIAGHPTGEAWGRLRNGLSIRVNLGDFNGRAAYFAGDTDRKITRLCERIVRPGDTVIDVGANIGIVTLMLAKLVGPQGRVFSYDPNPYVVQLLRQSIERNGLANVHLEQCAIGAEDGELVLQVPQGHSGRASLVRHSETNGSAKVQVQVRTLSDLVPASVRKVRLLKIDVEGFEPQVLRGAFRIFQDSPPDVVIVELNELQRQPSDHPSIQLLRGFGYEMFSIPKAIFRMGVVALDPAQAVHVGHDVLACRISDQEIASELTMAINGIRVPGSLAST